ncbi:hypothetical protein [Streptomyces sp. CA-111067]|uniref:hypothetical protein n=1 Tax=Streptomyces sp. CA-111067 TaxID=3240046 RepID=UPI003D96CDEA
MTHDVIITAAVLASWTLLSLPLAILIGRRLRTAPPPPEPEPEPRPETPQPSTAAADG